MVTTEIISLLELVRGLVNRKAELDRQYFEQFIEPAWEIFNKIHENYKSSFEEYYDLVSDSETEAALLRKIRRDLIDSSNLRSDLEKLLQNLPPTQFKTKKQHLLDFAIAIVEYFDARKPFSSNFSDKLMEVRNEGRRSSSLDDIEITQWVLNALYVEIEKIAFQEKQDRVAVILDRILSNLQTNYDRTAAAYFYLRKELLS